MDLCRLCTGDNNVIDIFDSHGERLRQCVLLATGINYNCDQSLEISDLDIDEIKKTVLALYNNVKNALLDDRNSEINRLKLKSSEEILVPAPEIHPSVEKLHRDNKNLILPEEVFHDNISPVVTLNANDVIDWYSKQAMSSENFSATAVHESSCSSNEEHSFIADMISSDSENEFRIRTVQLRNRSYRRILLESDSEDDSPRKKTSRKSYNSSSNIFPEKIQIVYDRLSEKLNSRNKSVQVQHPSIAFITVNQKNFDTISDVRKNFDSVEFKDYGIHFENTDSLYDDQTDTTTLYDKHILSSTEPSDDTDSEIELLFKKFYHHQINISTMCGGLNEEYVIRNMASEIRKYWVPIELRYANKNRMEALEETRLGLNTENDDTFWIRQECVDIQSPRCIYQNQFRRLENPRTSNSTAHPPIVDTIVIQDSDDEANYDNLTIDVSDCEEVIVVDDSVPSPASTISFNNGDNQFSFNPHSRTVTNPILNSEHYGFVPQNSFANTQFEAIQNEPRRYLLPTEIPMPLLEYERQMV